MFKGGGRDFEKIYYKGHGKPWVVFKIRKTSKFIEFFL